MLFYAFLLQVADHETCLLKRLISMLSGVGKLRFDKAICFANSLALKTALLNKFTTWIKDW